MKRTRFTDEQIIGILAEHEAGAKCADLCRKHGMSEGTFYNWKARFGGMTVSEAKRLKVLEDENAKLKKLLAEQRQPRRRAAGPAHRIRPHGARQSQADLPDHEGSQPAACTEVFRPPRASHHY